MTLQSCEDKELLDWSRHNQLKQAQRTIAYVLRFIKAVSHRLNQSLRNRIENNIPEIKLMTNNPYITATEHNLALRVLVRNHQNLYHATIPRNQNHLNLYKDQYGILRRKGRLGKADIPFDTQQPILIANNTKLAEIIIHDNHLPYHCSTGQTMANVRQNFWIPKLRQQTQKILKRCIACQKMNNLPFKYLIMEDLPQRRVQKSRPFEH
ncbi:hypothetical protein DICVIV_14343, partial [Dictyocaulus viviparus]